ncbi:MAG: zinc-dependent metalloprotease [Actinomycetota bacterium]|jgi:putative hydrolase
MAGFGFTPPDEPIDPNQNPNQNPNPFGNFGEIFQQFSSMGLNLQGLMSALSGQKSPASLSREMIRDISKKFLSAHGELPLSIADLTATQEAMNIADLWLNEATVFPPLPMSDNCALSRRDWIDSTLNGWEEIARPLVEGMSDAMAGMLKDNLGENGISLDQLGMDQLGMNQLGMNQLGMNLSGAQIPQSLLATIMGTFMSSLISTQLGQTIGNLSTTVTGANDVALPLSKEIRPALIPQNAANWGSGLGIDEGEVRIYLALRELAAARLFVSAPWLREYIKNAIASYGKGIRVDITAITEQAQEAMSSGELDPANPESLTLALSGGMFTPEETPTQKAALENLETVLALIDGWIDSVVTLAAKNRLPSLVQLRETQQRRRATKSPTQELFATLVGLEVSPRRTREAIAFWEKIVELRDVKSRDEIWDESFLLPRADQLGDAEAFLKSRTVPDDLSGLI